MYVLRALRPQQLSRCSAAALPACTSCISTSAASQQQYPQLMRVAQQQSNGSSDQQQQRSLWAYLGTGAAATAAGWTAWNYVNSTTTSAAPIDPMQLMHASQRGQAAVAACCAGPLLHLLHGLNPTPAQLQGLAAALESEAASLGPELVTGLWGLAMLGAAIPQQQLARLADAALQHMQQLPVYEAITTAWAVILLCSISSSSTSNSGSSDAQLSAISSSAWQQLLQRLQAAHHRESRDEASLLYLLHATMHYAAHVAAGDINALPAPSISPAFTTTSSSSTNGSSSSSSSGSTGNSSSNATTSTAAAAARDPGLSHQPHASLQEVLQAVQPLHDRIKKRLATAYQEDVPFQPYVEGPLLVLLHMAKTLPRYITAAAAAAGDPGASALVAVFGGLSAADAAAGSARIADPASLGKLKRDLFFRWRADELLDRHQQAVNQVSHVLYRRMQLPVQQGSDADLILPTLRAAVFIEDDGHSSLQGATGASAGPTPPPLNIKGSSPLSSAGTGLIAPLDAAPPSPFTAAFWMEAHVGFQQLMRNRFSAPPGGFVCRDCQGIVQAKVQGLRQRGWDVVVLRQSEIGAALGGFKVGRVKVGESYDYSRLQQLLRSRLGL